MGFQASSDFYSVLQILFTDIWSICTSFDIPGTNINIVEFVFGAMVIVFSLKHMLSTIFGNVGTENISADGHVLTNLARRSKSDE